MPNCKLCRERIDVSRTGVRAYKCARCGATVCKEHCGADKVCHGCAGLPVTQVRKSFIRRPGGAT